MLRARGTDGSGGSDVKNRWQRLTRLFVIPILLSAASCGSSGAASSPSPVGSASGCPGGTGSTGSMSAQINGIAWVAVCLTGSQFNGAVVSLGGSDNAVTLTDAQEISLATQAVGPGTFTIGPGITNGASGKLTVDGTQVWVANAGQGSGTITFTTLTPLLASGTFSLSLLPVPPATGTKTITSGVFSITF
jgi:DNA-binding beta-propeller fold protein YncE